MESSMELASSLEVGDGKECGYGVDDGLRSSLGVDSLGVAREWPGSSE
jgi:hypothetical protein